MFEDGSSATGKCPCRALDKESTHVARNITMNDIYNDKVPRSGDTRVYKPTNTHFPAQTSNDSKDDTCDYRKGYFLSSKYSYRDGCLHGLKPICGEGNGGCSGLPWVVSDKVGRVHTYVYSCRARANQICEHEHCSPRQDTEPEGRCDTSVENIRSGVGNSCSDRVLDSRTSVTTDRFPESRPLIHTGSFQGKWKDTNSSSVLLSRTDTYTTILQDNGGDRLNTCLQNSWGDNHITCVQNIWGDSHITSLQNKRGDSRIVGLQDNKKDSRSTCMQNNRDYRCTTRIQVGDCSNSSLHNRQDYHSVLKKREDNDIYSVHSNNRGRSIISVQTNRAVTYGVQNRKGDNPAPRVHNNRDDNRTSSVQEITEGRLINNAHNIRGDSHATIVQNRGDKRTSSVQNMKGDRRNTHVNNIRGDKRTTNVNRMGGDQRTTNVQSTRGDKRTTSVQIIGGDKRTTSVQNLGKDKRTTNVQNITRDKCSVQMIRGEKHITSVQSISGGRLTERARNSVCSTTKMTHRVMQYNQDDTPIAKQIGSSSSSGHIYRIIKSCKNSSQNDRSGNYTCIEYSKGHQQNNSSSQNSAINIQRNIDRDCTGSTINGNAENSPIAQHKYGTVQSNSVLHNKNIGTATRCTQYPDVNSSSRHIKPSICEHFRNQTLNFEVMLCQCSVPTSGVEDEARSCKSDRTHKLASSVHSSGNKKGLIASLSDGFLHNKSRYGHLPEHESFSTGRVQTTCPIQTVYVSTTDQSLIPSIDVVTLEASQNYPTHMFLGYQQRSTQIVDAVTLKDSRNGSTHGLVGCQERTMPSCPPHVYSQSSVVETLGQDRCNNLLTNRHIGNLLQPLNNLAIAEVPRLHRRAKLNRDIWPTETKTKTWTNGVKVGKEHKNVCKFTRAHELSHKRLNTERSSLNSTKPVLHSQSATFSILQQKKATDSTNAYLLNKTDTPDKSSKPTIPNRDSLGTLPQTGKQTSAFVPSGAEGPTGSCPVININSQPADTAPHEFVLSVEDVDSGNPDATKVTARKGGLLSVPGSELYFEGRPDLSE